MRGSYIIFRTILIFDLQLKLIFLNLVLSNNFIQILNLIFCILFDPILEYIYSLASLFFYKKLSEYFQHQLYI